MTDLLKGLLWFDNDPKKDWRDKVKDAAQAHQAKFWIKPDICHINPATVQLPDTDDTFIEFVDGIEVYARHNTQLHNFFVANRK